MKIARHLLTLVVLPMVMTTGGGLLTTSIVHAAGVDAGAVIVVDPIDTERELTEFDSNAAFRLRLPDDATCPGDSANDDYRVQTFLVPADTDLSTLKYRSLSPDGADLYRALRYVDGDISTQEMTDQNSVAGQEAAILDPMKPFTFAWYMPPNRLPAGRWKIGVACTPVPGWNVEKYWDAEVELADAPEVGPAGLRITVVSPSDGGPATGDSNGLSGTNPAVLIGAGVAAVIGVLALLRRRSRQPTRSLMKEAP